jgi:hypothetical protein
MVAEAIPSKSQYKPKPPLRIPGKLNRGSKTTKIREGLDLQDEMKAIATDESEKALARTAAARVWKEIGLFVMALRGVGVPAPVKTDPKSRQRKASTTPASEPTPAPVPGPVQP